MTQSAQAVNMYWEQRGMNVPLMTEKLSLKKRSVTIAGHGTSVSLENAFSLLFSVNWLFLWLKNTFSYVLIHLITFFKKFLIDFSCRKYDNYDDSYELPNFPRLVAFDGKDRYGGHLRKINNFWYLNKSFSRLLFILRKQRKQNTYNNTCNIRTNNFIQGLEIFRPNLPAVRNYRPFPYHMPFKSYGQC